MLQVIAPPPEIINQLVDLIAVVKNVDAVEKLVKDLQKSAAEHVKAVKALAEANAEANAKLEKLEKAESSLATKQAKLDKQKDAQDEKTAEITRLEAEWAGKAADIASKIAEFEVYEKAKKTELANLKVELDKQMEAANADAVAAAALRVDMETKLAVMKSALGA